MGYYDDEVEIVLCAASAYEQLYYLNEEFESLPTQVKEELQIMCVLYTEEVGGVLAVVFNEDGELELRPEHTEEDILYDQIGSILKIKELQQVKQELFEQLEMYYKVYQSLGEFEP